MALPLPDRFAHWAEARDEWRRSVLPAGVPRLVIEAAHECMTTRGIHKRGVSMITSKMMGTFRSDARTRNEFLTFIDIRDRR